jgi:hypothetical protein
VASYQQQVLSAAREVENGITQFLNARVEAQHLAASVAAAERAVRLATAMFNAGTIDFTPVFVAEQFLGQQQNLYAQAQGDVALGLIMVYRALGGGWEYRLTDPQAAGEPAGPGADPSTLEVLPPLRVLLGQTSALTTEGPSAEAATAQEHKDANDPFGPVVPRNRDSEPAAAVVN